MRKLPMLAGVLTCSLLLHQEAKAQSTAYFYQETQSQRTVNSLIGSPEYVGSETIFDPAGDNSVHIMYYNPAAILNPPSFQVNDINIDERNVDIVPISNTQFVHISYYSKIGSGTISIRAMLMDITGAILNTQIITSTNPQFNSLIAMDAVYDPANNQIVICGTAIKGTNASRATPKVAFVTRLNMALTVTGMHFYNSNSGAVQTDDDVANRIVLNSTGRYYITGSENVNKVTGLNMGIRNMLIDPITLNIVWDLPLALFTDGGENSVDMAQDPAGNFVTLVNFNQQNTWGIIRVDPASGNPITPQLEHSSESPEMGHTIGYGNAPNELVVKGMKYRTLTPCQTYDNNADPFAATLDVNPYPANLLLKNEDLTAVGTVGGAVNYWTLGGLYSPAASGYPVPIYANRFADRQNSGATYCALAPVLDPSGTLLNTKSIFWDPFTNTACPMQNCMLPLQTVYNILIPSETLTNNPSTTVQSPSSPVALSHMPYGQNDCASGYYKTTGIENVTPGATEMVVSPNPAVNSFNVTLGSAYNNSNVQVGLFDVSGRKVAEVFNGINAGQKINYNIPGSLASGMYFIEVASAGNKTLTQKIIVSK